MEEAAWLESVVSNKGAKLIVRRREEGENEPLRIYQKAIYSPFNLDNFDSRYESNSVPSTTCNSLPLRSEPTQRTMYHHHTHSTTRIVLNKAPLAHTVNRTRRKKKKNEYSYIAHAHTYTRTYILTYNQLFLILRTYKHPPTISLPPVSLTPNSIPRQHLVLSFSLSLSFFKPWQMFKSKENKKKKNLNCPKPSCHPSHPFGLKPTPLTLCVTFDALSNDGLLPPVQEKASRRIQIRASSGTGQAIARRMLRPADGSRSLPEAPHPARGSREDSPWICNPLPLIYPCFFFLSSVGTSVKRSKTGEKKKKTL